MAQTSYSNTSTVSYNASYQDDAVDALIEKYGDALQEISIGDKIHLLAILATWQAADTDYVSNPDYYNEWNLEQTSIIYPCETSEELDAVIALIADISDRATFPLMVALASQIVAEQGQ